MIKKIDVPIYNSVIYLGLKSDWTELRDIETPTNCLADFVADQAADAIATMCKVNGKIGYLIVLKTFEAGLVAHEAFHYMNKMFCARDIHYDSDNDEHAAYLLSWVIDEITKIIQEYIAEQNDLS